MLHEHMTQRGLTILRTGIFGMWFVSVLFDPLPVISYLPASAFHPAGFLLRVLPTEWQAWLITGPALHGLKFLTLVTLFGVLVNRFTKPAAVCACILLTVYQGIVRGFGHINHAEMGILYAAYFLTLFLFADAAYLKDKRGGTNVNLPSIAFISITAVMLFTFMFTGMFRLLSGGWELFISDTMVYWIVHNSHRESFLFLWNLDDWVLRYPLAQAFFKAGLPVTTLFEITAPLCLVWRGYRIVFVVVMGTFLILNFVFMNILFWQNFLLCALLIDWSRPRHGANLATT